MCIRLKETTSRPATGVGSPVCTYLKHSAGLQVRDVFPEDLLLSLESGLAVCALFGAFRVNHAHVLFIGQTDREEENDTEGREAGGPGGTKKGIVFFLEPNFINLLRFDRSQLLLEISNR